MRYYYLFSIFIFLFSSCSNDDFDPEELNQGSQYFPLETGNFWVYNLEKTEYSIDGSVNSLAYQTKITVIDSIVTDPEIIYSLKVERRGNENDEWSQIATWETYKNKNIAVLNYGSFPVIKLSFPVEGGRSWNANSLNAVPENEIFYDSIGRTFTGTSTDFENTITVVINNEDDDLNITSDYIEYEVYSKNIGLIYHVDIELHYKSCSNLYPECCEAGSINKCFDQIVEGYVMQQKLIEFGKE